MQQDWGGQASTVLLVLLHLLQGLPQGLLVVLVVLQQTQGLEVVVLVQLVVLQVVVAMWVGLKQRCSELWSLQASHQANQHLLEPPSRGSKACRRRPSSSNSQCRLAAPSLISRCTCCSNSSCSSRRWCMRSSSGRFSCSILCTGPCSSRRRRRRLCACCERGLGTCHLCHSFCCRWSGCC